MKEFFSKNIYNKIDNHKVISFDIFDTLLTRIVEEPEDIFRIMEYKLRIDGFAIIREKAQHAASKKAYKMGFAHANFEEIYQGIQKKLSLNKTETARIKDLELALEKQVLIIRNEGIKLFKYAQQKSKKIILISDMYLSETQLMELLENKGITNFHSLYVSSKMGYSKRDGDLYKFVLDMENIAPSDLLHIGDNVYSDIERANQLGISSFHLPLPEKKVVKKNMDISEIISNGIERYFVIQGQQDYWNALGSTIGGPLYINIYHWVNNLAKINGIDHLVLLGRDGYILYDYFKRLNCKFQVHYLETSRRALLLPSVFQLRLEDLQNFPPHKVGQSIKDLLDFLRIDIPKFVLEKYGFRDYDDIIISKGDIVKFKQCLFEMKNEIEDRGNIERKNLMKYWEQFNINEEQLDKTLFFDVGWNGSSQEMLQKILCKNTKTKMLKFAYFGLNFYSSHRKSKPVPFVYLDQFSQYKTLPIYQTPMLIELFFSQDKPSVHYYGENDIIRFNDIDSLEKIKKINTGIVNYLTLFEKTYNYSEFELVISKKGIDPLRHLILHPNPEDIKMISMLNDLNDSTKSSKQKEALAPAYRSLNQAIKNRFFSYWPKATLLQSSHGIVRCSLYLITSVRKARDYLNIFFHK